MTDMTLDPLAEPLEPQAESAVAVAVPAAVPAAAPVRRRDVWRRSFSAGMAGLTAIGVKELRGRMRGRRAFTVLTIYLVILGVFAWMVEQILERSISQGFGSATFASAQVGQGLFAAILMLLTLLVVALAPAYTAGAISLEREKQTLDLLAATPVSSLAIVLGKLLAALTYVVILVLASIPLTAIVFVFGGVAPEDVVRGYLVLLITAVGLGSVGLFFSALIKRTQAATVATYFGVLTVTLGAFFVWTFWTSVTGFGGNQRFGPIQGSPPEAILYLNPFVAEADVLCGTESGAGGWCSLVSAVTNRPMWGQGQIDEFPRAVPMPGLGIDPGMDDVFIDADGVLIREWPGGRDMDLRPVPVQQQAFGLVRDAFWPRSAAAWLVLSVVLIFASVQLVTPTRRWRPRLPGIPRRFRFRRRST